MTFYCLQEAFLLETGKLYWWRNIKKADDKYRGSADIALTAAMSLEVEVRIRPTNNLLLIYKEIYYKDIVQGKRTQG